MKRFLLAILICFASVAYAQRQNVEYVDQFPGPDLGTKITAAQAACNPAVQCIIEIDSNLANYAVGSLPSACAKCTWVDWRTNPFSVGGSALLSTANTWSAAQTFSSYIQASSYRIAGNTVLQDNASDLAVGSAVPNLGTFNTCVGYFSCGGVTNASTTEDAIFGNRAMASQNQPGTGMVITVNTSGGVITSCVVTTPGTGYLIPPQFNVDAAGGGVNGGIAVTSIVSGGGSGCTVVGSGGTGYSGPTFTVTPLGISLNAIFGYTAGRGTGDGSSFSSMAIFGTGACTSCNGNTRNSVIIGTNTAPNGAGLLNDTFVGDNAALAITNGGSDSFFGRGTGKFVTSGSYDLCGGHAACWGLTTGYYNSMAGGTAAGEGDGIYSFQATGASQGNTFYGTQTGIATANGVANYRIGLGYDAAPEADYYASIGGTQTSTYAVNTFTSGLSLSTRSVSGADTATPNDATVECSATQTEQLPASPRLGEIFEYKMTAASGTCTLSGNGHNIDGAASIALTTQYSSLMVQWDGTQWRTITSSLSACATCVTDSTGGALSATSPVTVSAGGLIACATCVTDSGGGALTATSPVTVSAAGLIAISGITGEQGNGAKLQLSTGSVTSNTLAKFDANGNVINASTTDNGTAITNTEYMQGPNGSLTNPTYGFTNCTNCGIYYTGAASSTALVSAGVAVLTVNSTPQVVLTGNTPFNWAGTIFITPTAASHLISIGQTTGTNTGFLQVAGVAGSGTATFGAGAGAGTSPGTPTCTTSHICDSQSGTISLTMGTSPPTTGVLLTVTTVTRTNLPNCHLDLNLTASPFTSIPVFPSYTTSTIVFNLTGTAPTASTAYTLTYSGCGGI